MDGPAPRQIVRSGLLLIGVLEGMAVLAHYGRIPGADLMVIRAAQWLGPLGAWPIALTR